MRIASICRVLPTPADPAAGAFVARRLAAMSRLAQLHAIQPVPYFPAACPLPGWVSAPPPEAGELPIERVPMFYFPRVLKALDGRWLARSIMPALRRLATRRGIDVIDAHFGYPDGVGCVIAGTKLGLPVFVTVRGMEIDALRHPTIGPQLTRALRQAAGCVCVSHSLRDVLAANGIPVASMLVAPNAVDRSAFRPGDRAAAREQLGLPADRRYIISVGHLVRGKRHDELVRALAQLRRRLPDVELVIIGGPAYDASHPGQLRRLVEECGLSEVVHFAGKVNPARIPLWLQAADVFALATEREGCCNAVLEALACGLPVVTTPAGDNPYFVEDGANGCIVPIGDVPAMTQALYDTLQRSWDAGAISASLQVTGWDGVARQVLDFFSQRTAASAGAA